jgi:glycerophosphoryl diester phosphodiesterase
MPPTSPMSPNDAIPPGRPLAIAHRAGNDRALAQQAIELGADMLETDVWLHRDLLEVRHDERISIFGWELPFLHDGWKPRRLARSLRRIDALLDETPIETRLFLDLKGTSPTLGVRLVEWIGEHQPDRHIIVCGRSWNQLDAIESLPHVVAVYSVGDENELASFWTHAQRLDVPAISLRHTLATPEVMARLKAVHALVICWTVHDPERVTSLTALGVDGFTTDNLPIIASIIAQRMPHASTS